ncbi:MAG: iron-containing alcohol dehydrogenase family protein [Lachnospiraceae bacterium]|nr:iron-containing alcohol dehydrogenase family protein [Lachnospiraceae bacterium]
MNRFRLPNHLIIEEGILNDIPVCMKDVFPDLKNAKTILVTTEHLKKLFQNIIEEMQKDFPQSELCLIEAASYDNAVALAKYITMNDIKVVIGFGGGTVLDLAKFAAFVSKAKLISLPTALSNDSLASPVAVLGTEGKARKSFRCTIPDAIIVDLDIVKHTPERQLLAGIGDTVSKYTALYDWKLAGRKNGEPVDDFACMMSHMAFESILFNTAADLQDRDFIRRLTDALVMGGLAMEIAGNSRPSSGSEHLFCHALEEEYPEQLSIPHGIATAMGTYPACIFQDRDPAKVTKVIKQYGIPARPSENGVTEDIFVNTWQKAAGTRADRYTILNETDLSDARLKEIYARMEEDLCSR